MLDYDDNLDEIEKALVQFSRQEGREAKEHLKERNQVKQDTRRRSTGAAKGFESAFVESAKVKGLPRRSKSLGSTGKALLGGLEKGENSSVAGEEVPSAVPKDGRFSSCGMVEIIANSNSGNPKRDKRRKSSKSRKLEKEGSSRSLGSNKSLPLASLHSVRSEPKTTMVGSNRSLMSLCSPKDQLMNVFGTTDFLKNINWAQYFGENNQDAPGHITPEMEYALKAKSVKKLRKVWHRGVNMNARNDQGETFVHLVCRQGCPEMLMFLISEAKASVRVRDDVGKNPLHEVCWRPNFEPGIAMMIMSDSPELLWATDARGFMALDYVPKRVLPDYYEFMEMKSQMLRLALKFSRFKASSEELSRNHERLKLMLERHLSP